MKLIELQAHGRIYFINPAQITHVEGKEGGDSKPYVEVHLTETKEGTSESLRFTGNEAVNLFVALRSLGR